MWSVILAAVIGLTPSAAAPEPVQAGIKLSSPKRYEVPAAIYVSGVAASAPPTVHVELWSGNTLVEWGEASVFAFGDFEYTLYGNPGEVYEVVVHFNWFFGEAYESKTVQVEVP